MNVCAKNTHRCKSPASVNAYDKKLVIVVIVVMVLVLILIIVVEKCTQN